MLRTSSFWAKFILVALLLTVIRDIGIYLQNEYVLISPLIPAQIIHDVSRPFLLWALMLSGVSLAALILYFFPKEPAGCHLRRPRAGASIWISDHGGLMAAESGKPPDLPRRESTHHVYPLFMAAGASLSLHP